MAKPCLVLRLINRGDEVSFADVHPTQTGLGFEEVKSKAEKLADLSDKKRDKYLMARPAPVIWGPDGYYAEDRQHLLAAVDRGGYPHAYGYLIEDHHLMPLHEFQVLMVERGLFYLNDEHGEGPIHVAKLPRSFSEMKDDPYRSLAWAVREAGGFQKEEDSPYFMEFMWANFFRERVEPWDGKKGFKEATEKALMLARSPEAASLPGFITPDGPQVISDLNPDPVIRRLFKAD